MQSEKIWLRVKNNNEKNMNNFKKFFQLLPVYVINPEDDGLSGIFFKRCFVGNQNFISKSFEIKIYFFPNKKSTFRLKLQSLSRLKNNITQAWIM